MSCRPYASTRIHVRPSLYYMSAQAYTTRAASASHVPLAHLVSPGQTTICVSSYYYVCPRATIHARSHILSVLVLLQREVCASHVSLAHLASPVPACYYICVLYISVCPHAAIYVCSLFQIHKYWRRALTVSHTDCLAPRFLDNLGHFFVNVEILQ